MTWLFVEDTDAYRLERKDQTYRVTVKKPLLSIVVNGCVHRYVMERETFFVIESSTVPVVKTTPH